MIEKFKFLIARLLDRKPNYCWANLAMWAMDYYSTWETFFAISRNVDKLLCEKGREYCGKCRVLKEK